MCNVKISSGVGKGKQQFRKLAEPKSEPLMIFYCFHFLKILNFEGKYILFGSILAINLPINFLVSNSFIAIYKQQTSAKTSKKTISIHPPILYGKPNILEVNWSYGRKGADNPFFRVRTILFETRKNCRKKVLLTTSCSKAYSTRQKKQFRNTYGKSNGTTATARCARTCCWEPSSTTGRV